MCDEGLLGDEYHFALFCEKLKKERTNMFIELVLKSDIELGTDQNTMFKAMFQRDCLKTTGKHIEIMFKRRKELLYSKDQKQEITNTNTM